MSKNSLGSMSMEQRRQFAAQVKQVRLELGLTQQDLADAASVSRQTVSNLERGTVPQAENLARILDTLGIHTSTSEFSEDTDMWLGVLGGMLESLPPMRRGVAGQAAVSAVAAELASGHEARVVRLDDHRVGRPGQNTDSDARQDDPSAAASKRQAADDLDTDDYDA